MTEYKTLTPGEVDEIQLDEPGGARLTVLPDESIPPIEPQRLPEIEHNRGLMDKITQRFGRIERMTPEGFTTFQRSLAKHRGLSSSMRGLLAQYARDVRRGTLPPEDAMQKIREAEENRLTVHRVGLEGAMSIAGGPVGAAAGKALGVGGRLAPGIGRLLGGATGAATGSLAAESFDPTENPGLSAALAAGASPVGDLMGAGINKLITGGFMKKMMKPGAKEMIGALPPDKTLTLGIATDNTLVDMAENISANSIGGAGRMLRARTATQEWAEGNIRAYINSLMTGSKEELGEVMQRAVAGSFRNFKQTSRGFYKVVDEFSPTTKVNVYRVKQTASKLLAQTERGVVPSGQARTVLEKIIDLPDLVTFEQASIIRSDLLSIGRSGQDLIAGRAQSFGKTLTPSLTSSMQKAAKGVSPEALAAWRTASAHWKSGIKNYNSQVIKAIAAREPEVVYQTAIKNARPGTIRRVRKIVNDDKVWQQVQGQYLDDIFKASATGKEFKVSASGLQRRLNTMGDDALQELFPKDGAAAFKRFVEQLNLAQGETTANVGRMMVQMIQGGVFFKAWLAPGPEDFVVLGAPAVAARLFSNPNFVKWMTVANKGSVASREVINALAKMKAMALKQGFVENVEPDISVGP